MVFARWLEGSGLRSEADDLRLGVIRVLSRQMDDLASTLTARIESASLSSGELSELHDKVQQTKDTTTRTEEKVDAHRELLEQIFAQVVRDKGVPGEPLRKILERLGEAGVPSGQIQSRLEALADELITLRAQLASLQFPELSPIRERVKKLLDEGDLNGARELLAKARQQKKERRELNAREEAALLSDEAAIDRLEICYLEAARKWGEAADLVVFDAEVAGGYRKMEAGALYAQGHEFGDNESLRSSIEVYGSLLLVYARERLPLQWCAFRPS